jgi:adenine-specific DNA-methyltransferase
MSFGGSGLNKLIPGREFPFPKSLYAVEDALRFFVKDKPDAVILDFFGGSGTTAHAVFRLNHQDNGRRQSILVTNNEVSEEEAKALRSKGLSPGDAEWEALGIFQHVTVPRVTAAMTGTTPDGEAIAGDYKFTDEFPMADGFDENVEFFELSYLDQNEVSRGKTFEAIAPLLWMKAGANGPRIGKVHKPFVAPAGARYAILFDINRWHEFAETIREREDLRHIFIVTDSQAQYQQVVAELPQTAEVSMLYEDYLRNFEINVGGAQ